MSERDKLSRNYLSQFHISPEQFFLLATITTAVTLSLWHEHLLPFAAHLRDGLGSLALHGTVTILLEGKGWLPGVSPTLSLHQQMLRCLGHSTMALPTCSTATPWAKVSMGKGVSKFCKLLFFPRLTCCQLNGLEAMLRKTCGLHIYLANRQPPFKLVCLFLLLPRAFGNLFLISFFFHKHLKIRSSMLWDFSVTWFE